MKSYFQTVLASLLARQVRRFVKHHKPIIVAVGGSVGKTSTRANIVTLLRHKYKTQSVAQPGYNSAIGLPLSVFEMSTPAWLFNPFAWAWRLVRSEYLIHAASPHQALVLELGTDHPGEMEHYLSFLTPDLALITAVTPEHMANFTNLDAVAAEELRLARVARQVLVNQDGVAAKYRAKDLGFRKDIVYYGLTDKASYHAQVKSTSLAEGTIATFKHGTHPIARDVRVKVWGTAAISSVLAAVAAADTLGLTPAQIAAGLAQIRPVEGRSRIFKGALGSTIIDDTYNSSPAALESALSALLGSKLPGRRIAILGSMNELGAASAGYHESLGQLAAGLDLLVTVGDEATKYLAPAAMSGGLDPTRVSSAPSAAAAGDYVRLLLAPTDTVLVKGSQNGIFCEEATKKLLADPADAAHLVRQSRAWLGTKRRLGVLDPS